MTELLNYQFELDGVVFGKGAPVAVDAEGFDRGEGGINEQDTYIPGSESIAFGKDTHQPQRWTWEAHTDTAEFPDEALEDLAALERAWKNPAIRGRSQAVSTLRYRIANRTRRVFGRPGRWSEILDNRILSGMAGAVAEFRRADLLYYGDEELSASITATPAEPTGFTTPLVFPLVTMASTTGGETITTTDNPGTVPAPFKITLIGPDTGAAEGIKVYGSDWWVKLKRPLEAGEVFVISSFPWGPRAIRNETDNVAGWIETSGAISSLRIPVEGDTLWFDAIDGSGTAQCVVSWYPTYDTF